MRGFIVGEWHILALIGRHADGRHDTPGTIKPCHRATLNANLIVRLSVQLQPLSFNGDGRPLRTIIRINGDLLLELRFGGALLRRGTRQSRSSDR